MPLVELAAKACERFVLAARASGLICSLWLRVEAWAPIRVAVFGTLLSQMLALGCAESGPSACSAALCGGSRCTHGTEGGGAVAVLPHHVFS